MDIINRAIEYIIHTKRFDHTTGFFINLYDKSINVCAKIIFDRYLTGRRELTLLNSNNDFEFMFILDYDGLKFYFRHKQINLEYENNENDLKQYKALFKEYHLDLEEQFNVMFDKIAIEEF